MLKEPPIRDHEGLATAAPDAPAGERHPVADVDPAETPRHGHEPQQGGWANFVNRKQPTGQVDVDIRDKFLRAFDKAWEDAEKQQHAGHENEHTNVYVIAAEEARKELVKSLPMNATVTMAPDQFMQFDKQIHQIAQNMVSETRIEAGKFRGPMNPQQLKVSIQRTVRQRLGTQTHNHATCNNEQHAHAATAPRTTLKDLCSHLRINIGLGEVLPHSHTS